MTDANIAAQKEILVRLELLLEQEEIFWIQRARANWLKHGDRNTEFFHNYATQRKRRNTIKGLVDNLGVLHEEREAMCKLVQDFFESLHTSEVQDIDASVLNDVQKKVSVEMNRGLTAPFTPDEVRKVLFSIGDLKAPGPDGLHAVFYKRFWDMLGGDLVQEVLQAINTATIPEGWNNTTIVLIQR